MKVVHIIPGKVWGGAEQYILDLSGNLAANGHDVVLIANDAAPVRERLERSRLKHHYLPLRRGSAGAIGDIIRDADVVHIHDTKHVSLAIKAKDAAGSDARIVLTRHIARASRTLPWRRHYYRRLHKIIFVSNLAMSLWHSANPWFDSQRMQVVLNSVPDDTGHSAAVSLRDKYGIPADTPLIAFTGRIRRSKGCETIVRALATLKHLDWRMVFIGACKPSGYIEKTLKPLARRLGIADRIYFHGFADNVRQLISDTDIGVGPSIVRESCHLSPMEFMLNGKCVITSNNGAQPEYITDGANGLLIPPGDTDALADRLRLVITDTTERRHLGDTAKQYYKNHLAYQVFIDKILDVYKN